MGVEKEKHKIELKDMNFYVNKLTGTVQIFPRVPLLKNYTISPMDLVKLVAPGNSTIINFFKYLKNNLKGKLLKLVEDTIL